MGAHFERNVVLQLRVLLIVERKQFFDEFGVVAVQLLAVLLEVEDGPGLGLHLVQVQVVHSGNFVGSLRPLHRLALVHLSQLLSLFGYAQTVLDAELVVASLLLPELLQLFSLSQLEREGSLLNGQLGGAELVQQFALESQLREGDVASVGVHARVDELQFGVRFLDDLLNFLPVDLEVLTFGDLGAVSGDDGIVEILFDEDDLAVLVVLVFLLGFLLLDLSLDVALLLYLFGERLVVLAADGLSVDFKEGTVFAGSGNVLGGPQSLLDVVAVEEVGDGDVAVLVGLDLLAEELVFGKVLVGEVVLNLLFNLSGVGNHFVV